MPEVGRVSSAWPTRKTRPAVISPGRGAKRVGMPWTVVWRTMPSRTREGRRGRVRASEGRAVVIGRLLPQSVPARRCGDFVNRVFQSGRYRQGTRTRVSPRAAKCGAASCEWLPREKASAKALWAPIECQSRPVVGVQDGRLGGAAQFVADRLRPAGTPRPGRSSRSASARCGRGRPGRRRASRRARRSRTPGRSRAPPPTSRPTSGHSCCSSWDCARKWCGWCSASRS